MRPERAGVGRAALKGVAAVVLAGVVALMCAWLAAAVFGGRGGDRASILPVPVTPDLVARGAYLAEVGDCTACHTAPGGAPFAGGLAIASPIGVIFSTNITPDPRTGIGGYTYGDFERAVRRGLLRSGRTMYPAMPYPSYSRIGDGDLAALYAYFMHGVAPVLSRNRAEQVRWPLSARWPLTYWRWLFAPQVRAFAPHAGENPLVARGAYLVEGLGHCGACHTPRALTLQEVALTAGNGSRYLAGSQFNGWFAPSLRGEAVAGLGRWAGADIEEFLASGRTGKFTAFGEMGEVVLHSTQYMTPADRAAIASFLHTLPPARGERAVAVGSQAYLDNCSACHQEDGTGLASGFPALAGNPVVNTDDPTSLIHVVLAGDAVVNTHAAPSKLIMPPFGASLSDKDIADLLTYVRSSWGNHAPAVSAGLVKTLRGAIGETEPAAQSPPNAATGTP
jgi:alcohol dehydrogenase (quinone), cytochrome c subunit